MTKKLNLLILVLLTSLYSLSAKTRFVATFGNDQNPGTYEKPYHTIQKGLDETFAGDTLYIRGGAYYLDEPLRVKNSGTHNNWVTIMAFNKENVGINGNNFLMHKPKDIEKHFHHQGIFHIEKVKYIRVQDLSLRYSHIAGFMVRGKETSNIDILNCKIYSTFTSAIGLWYADSLRVMYCEVVDANNQDHRPIGHSIRREAPHEAISVAGCTNFEIAHNYLHLCQKEGIDVKEFSAHGKVHHNLVHDVLREGIYIDCWFGLLHNVEVYNNIVHHCEWGILISAEGKGSSMKNIKIHNNLVYKNRGLGIAASVIGKDEPRDSIFIFNNTICFNGTPGHWSGKTGGIRMMSRNMTNVFVYNNLLYENYGFQIATYYNPKDRMDELAKNRVFIENNMMDSFHDCAEPVGFYGVQVYATKGQNPIIAHPMLQNPENSDFRLHPGSPAFGKGISKDMDEPQRIGAEVEKFGFVMDFDR